MTSTDRVKTICKERKIPLSKLERDCGFGNGYISQLKKGLPEDRCLIVAKYLGVTTEYLCYGSSGKSELDVEFEQLFSEMSDGEKMFILGVMKTVKENRK